MVHSNSKNNGALPSNSPTPESLNFVSYNGEGPALLPPLAQKKLQGWICSRHLICDGNFFVFESVDQGAIERFSSCIRTLGGSLISVQSVGMVWIGNHRQVVLYRARASLYTPCHSLKQYWIKYGSFYSRFDARF